MGLVTDQFNQTDKIQIDGEAVKNELSKDRNVRPQMKGKGSASHAITKARIAWWSVDHPSVGGLSITSQNRMKEETVQRIS